VTSEGAVTATRRGLSITDGYVMVDDGAVVDSSGAYRKVHANRDGDRDEQNCTRRATESDVTSAPVPHVRIQIDVHAVNHTGCRTVRPTERDRATVPLGRSDLDGIASRTPAVPRRKDPAAIEREL